MMTQKIDQVEVNQVNISKNRRRIFELDTTLQDNNFQTLNICAMIEENREAILKNYAATYVGNRQLINANRAMILKNRMTVLAELKTEGDVQANFKNSLMNQATIEFMEVQAKLDISALEVSDLLSKANALLIDANMKIMAKNAELVEFNRKNTSMNTEIIEGGITVAKATPKTNTTRITSNAKRLDALEKLVNKEAVLIRTVAERVMLNRAKIEANAQEIQERRELIIENRISITKNRRRQNILSMVG